MIIKNFKDYIENILEGLIITHPGDIVLLNIIGSLREMGLNVDGKFDNNKITLELRDFNFIPINKIESLFDHILVQLVNRGGWFPASMQTTTNGVFLKTDKYDFFEIIKNHNNYSNIKITFESKFDVIEDNIPSKLYHLTIKEYEKSINKHGLVPKSKSKLTSHLDRIYVCKSIEDCKFLIPKMIFYYTGEKDENIYKKGKKLYNKDITPIIYEIDNSDNFIDKLYIDINYSTNGFYTLENIPSKLLKNINY